jgi:hypothetical protein
VAGQRSAVRGGRCAATVSGRRRAAAGGGRRLALRDRLFLAFDGVLTSTFNKLTSVGPLSGTAASEP